MRPNGGKIIIRVIAAFFGVILILVGLVFGGVSLAFRISQDKLRDKCSGTAEAEVIKLVSDSDKASAPIFLFSVDGKKYQVTYSNYSDPPRYSVGEKVQLNYDPDAPTTIFVPGDKTLRTIITVFIAVGGGLVLMGLVVIILGFVLTRKLGRTPPPQYQYQQYGM
ncbi:Protein of unknown function [Ruminococcus sp. YE71]|uniref:DUF3592 domain-containing protein n=1 Tax=unclassified Ruminococcus TaxID=2608920 RepID=UPI000891F352|nr:MULTISPECIES: DUF3592 domain-containing protein [unclassified Ruminococcus]SDA16185.1 Protein of unknown function [Ruminococcus sp. YE78]SFW24137.1 Protein of unknown function [Ruminococcus sp. YE71]